ncbi:formate/nitrite transporter family member [Pavlovales sp. CCMP2436]|nr:formate/nitrite transporter family member [Pavlovales sp. CCMP2436]|eukprot:CAMPEP_0180006488 /NCGR_PEP_ID=MMETSP0984-20121128/13322_1 /TAXON_ID=483367 /ORGANISM="non described non described, Strain CCMP 2436" /LENGTH=299 /DNA_ID=CAMNT_0021927403 /DNA_START=25 /DNA_END=924 /DNA_ORIENTATION=+
MTTLAVLALAASAFVHQPRLSVAVRTRGGSTLAIRASDLVVPPQLKPPAAIYEGVIAAGAAKAAMPASKIFTLGVISGCHIAFGSCLAIMIGGACPGIKEANPGLQRIIFGAFGLPFGLLMTLITGAELFTGNTALVTTAVFNGKATQGGLAKSWFYSYAGNFVGSVLVAYLFAASGVMHKGAIAIASAKVATPWIQAFIRGVLANWLVCMAVWMASGCSDLVSKAVAIWFPISSFVAMGLEHSVANMAIIPLGMMMGAPVSMRQFIFGNLVPVTLGNAFAGVFCIALAYTMAFGKTKK